MVDSHEVQEIGGLNCVILGIPVQASAKEDGFVILKVFKCRATSGGCSFQVSRLWRFRLTSMSCTSSIVVSSKLVSVALV